MVADFYSTGHTMWMNDFFLVKAFALWDKLDGAIISAIKRSDEPWVHQRFINKNFSRILKIKSVVSFQKDIQKVKFWSRFGGYF